MSVLDATTSAPTLLRQPNFPRLTFDLTQNPYRAWNTELAYSLFTPIEFQNLVRYVSMWDIFLHDDPFSETYTGFICYRLLINFR